GRAPAGPVAPERAREPRRRGAPALHGSGSRDPGHEPPGTHDHGAASAPRPNPRFRGLEHGVDVVIGGMTTSTPCSAGRGSVVALGHPREHRVVLLELGVAVAVGLTVATLGLALVGGGPHDRGSGRASWRVRAWATGGAGRARTRRG